MSQAGSHDKVNPQQLRTVAPPLDAVWKLTSQRPFSYIPIYITQTALI